MKIGAINYFRNISKYTNAINVKYNPSPSFNGVSDVFSKQNKISKEEQIDFEIKEILQSAKQTDKTLQKSAGHFLLQLNTLLKIGKRKNFQGSFPFFDLHARRKTFSFSDIDDNFGIPPVVNIWEEGKLKTVFEIYSTEPMAAYHVTDYKENSVSEYNFVGKTNIGYYNKNDGGYIVKHYAAQDGFLQQQAQVKDGQAVLLAEMYYNYKNPEQSFFRENTSEGIVEYGFDKGKNFWSEQRIISQEEYDEKYGE